MPESAFTPHGPEGRPREGGSFEDQLEAFGETLGWKCLERNVDLLTGKGSESRGLDLVWSIANPLTGRGEGWIGDGKRHDSMKRYTVELLGDEVHAAREKVARANSARFLEDARIAPYVQSVPGALVFHRTPRYECARVGAALARIDLRNKTVGAQTPRVLVVGSDTLNGLAETFRRFGMPEAFHWPASRGRDAVWARGCPPGQLGRGLVAYRSTESGTVLWLRGTLEANDVPMLVDLAHLVGDIDIVAVTELTVEERRMIERQWRRAVQQSRARATGKLPTSLEALDLAASTMSPFDHVWPTAPDTTANDTTSEVDGTPLRRAGRIVGARRVVASEYPLPSRFGEAVRRKATLSGARSALAAEGVVAFADEKVGIAAAFEEGMLLPSSCRRVADCLDLTVSTSIRGFELTRMPNAQISLTPPAPAIEEFIAVAHGVVEEHFGTSEVALTCIEAVPGRWSHRLLLRYDRLIDIDGGARVLSPSHVEFYVGGRGDSVELAVLSRRSSDVESARTWLHGILGRFEHAWIPEPIGLPHTEPRRSQTLATLLTTLAGYEIVAVGQPAGVRDALRTVETEDDLAQAMLAADYRTRAIPVEVALKRIESDQNAFASLVAFAWGPVSQDGTAPVIAIQLRQPLDDAHLTLSWATGKKAEAGLQREPAALVSWEDFGPLHDWPEERKRRFLLDAYADALDRLREAADAAALRLSA